MNDHDLDHRMQAVLDGEATPEEAGAIERLLAADPAARARFEDLTRLFRDLGKVPRVQPPDGFGPAVMERVALRPPRRAGWRQLFSRSRVYRQVANEARGVAPGSSTWTHRDSRPGHHAGGTTMTQQGNGSSKRNLWIGTGVAAAAVVFGVYYVSDFPADPGATSGTIAPAQRFRAQQPTASDVKLGDQAGSTASQVNPAAQTSNQAASQASSNAANSAASQAASNAANQAASQASSNAANKAASQASSNAASQAASQASSQAASNAANKAASQAANQAASKAASEAMKK